MLKTAVLLVGLMLAAVPIAPAAPLLTETTPSGRIAVEEVAAGLDHPWSLAFLPDGRMLVSERVGRLTLLTPTGGRQDIAGVPAVAAAGQGGLLDIALDPAFASNRRLYLTYAEPRAGGHTATAVARAVLDADGAALRELTVLFRQAPTHAGAHHFGSRLAFAPDGSLFVTLGERYALRDKAQDLSTHVGKVVRLTTDGKAPADNPFVGQGGARAEIWSYGHRNPQGAAINPDSGELWTLEHGPRGGDEVNITRRGLNYGWPVVTHGVDYSGAAIGEGRSRPGMEPPLHVWVPSIAPSGMLFYTGSAFPAWRGSVFTGALAGQALVRLSREGDRITGEERLLTGLSERIRDVRQGPDGLLYLLTDAAAPDGRVLRVRPES